MKSHKCANIQGPFSVPDWWCLVGWERRLRKRDGKDKARKVIWDQAMDQGSGSTDL